MSRARPVHHHSHAVGGLCVVVASVARAIFSICAQARQFETTFVDPYTRGRCTVTFWVGEPVLYHPGHLAKPVFTHIDLISDGFFVVANSTTGRMIPFAQTQKVLKVKLSLDEIEELQQGGELDPAERLLWRRWVSTVNHCNHRKSRVQVQCCGRYKFRYQLAQDTDGKFFCDNCWAAVPPCPPAAQHVAEVVQHVAEVVPASVAAADVAAGEAKAVLLPRDDWDAEQSTKRRKHTHRGPVDSWNPHKAYGFAFFEGYQERVLFHAKDCGNMQPSVGDAVSAIVHRRKKDSKLQAFRVEQAETMEQRLDRVHNTLLGSS